MKTIVEFYGKLEHLATPPDASIVTLINKDTKEELETTAVTQNLLDAGVNYDGCEFEVIVLQLDDGKHEAIIKKLEPKKLTPEQVKKIKDDLKDIDLSEPKEKIPYWDW